MNIKKKIVSRKRLRSMVCFFTIYIRADPLLGVGYVAVRQITCSCSVCLSKLYFSWNRSQYKYNQDQYRGENQNCVYWPIIGSYNNWQIIHFVCSRKQHKSIDTDINFHI